MPSAPLALPSAAGLAIARAFAAANPQAKLPCPICAATLRADNFEKHLGKVHAARLQAPSPPPSTPILIGSDRRIGRTLLALPILWAIAVAVIAALRVPLDDTTMIFVGSALALALVPPLLAAFGLFRARLVVQRDRLELHHTLGLRTTSVPLVATKLEVGTLRGARPSAIVSGYGSEMSEGQTSEETTVGNYLKISAQSAAIVVGCLKPSGLRQHWDPRGWRPGPRLRAWDITLDRESMIALEYLLVDRQVLALRPDTT